MAVIAPNPIDAGPIVPSSADSETTFDAAYEAFNTWEKTKLQPQANALATNVYNNATEAVAAASTAVGARDDAADSASAANADALRLASLDALWLGAAAADPATGRAGAALVAGNAYVNTGTGLLRTYNGTAWVNALNVTAGVDSINGTAGTVTLKTVGGASLVGTGDLPIDAYQVGDTLLTSRALSEPSWLGAGLIYLKSSYPALATLIADKTLSWSTSVSVPNGTGTLNGLCRITDSIAVAVGNAGAVWRTVDSGATWSKINGPETINLNGVAAYGNTVVAVGASGKTWRSTDAGATWVSVAGPNITDALISVAFSSGGWMVAVGIAGVVWRSSTSGTSWTTVAGPNTSDNLFKVAAYDSQHFVAVGISGAVWRSVDGGATWAKITGPNTTDNLRALAVYSSASIIAAGDSGVAWLSRDSGASWQKTSIGTSTIFSIAIAGSNIIASGAVTFVSSDAGSTWRQTYHPASRSINASVALTDKIVVGVGAAGIAIRSESGVAYCRSHTPATQFVTPQSVAPAGLTQYIKA